MTALAGPAIFRGTRLEVEPGEEYLVGCPWCRRTFVVIGPEVIDQDHLRAWHDRLHVGIVGRKVVNT